MQARTEARNGLGVSEASQDLISQMFLGVVESDGTPRGTALAMHSLASSAGSTKWAATPIGRNRVFPPAAATNVLSAVSGTIAGDHLVLEAGYRNFTVPVATGGSLNLRDQAAAADLPEDEFTSTALNPWLEIRAISGATGSGHHPDLVGTSNQAARCDHSHHVLSNRAPTTADNIDEGYPQTTLWTNTETSQTYLLIDEDAGTWILVSSAGEHTHTVDEITDLSEPTSVVTDHGSMGAAEEFDFSVGSDHEGVQNADLTVTLTATTAGEAAWLTLVLTQDGTGGHSLTLPGSVANAADVEAAWDQTPSTVNVLTLFTYDGGTTWYGFLAGGSGGSAGGSLDEHDDVIITGPAEDDELRFNGSSWVNDARKWEVVTDGEDVLVWEDDDLVYEWNEAP
jgi:hypothetical protein